MPKIERLTEELNNKMQRENADGSYFNGAYDEKNILRRKADGTPPWEIHPPNASLSR